MSGDFGDESGQKLIDDYIRFAERVGIEKMRERAYSVKRACDHAQAGALAEEARGDVPWAEPREWAKLDMGEFREIEGYDEIRSAIESKMSARGVEFQWHLDEGADKEYLLFKIRDAREVWRGFGELSRESEEACGKAAEAAQRSVEERAAGREVVREEGEASRGAHVKAVFRKHDVPGLRGIPAPDGLTRDEGDARRLAERAAHAREASAALEGEGAATRLAGRAPRFQEVRSK